MGMDGQPVRDEKRPLYLERFIHAGILEARPDVMAVHNVGPNPSENALVNAGVEMSSNGPTKASGSAAINAILNGADLVIIATSYNLLPYNFFAVKGINKPEDLKGKKIGIAGFRSAMDILLKRWLKLKGIDPDRQSLRKPVTEKEKESRLRQIAEAKRLGMSASRFANASGLPASQHYSTAQDLARLNLNVTRLSTATALRPRLVHMHRGVGERIAHSLRSSGQQHCPKAHGHPVAYRRDFALYLCIRCRHR